MGSILQPYKGEKIQQILLESLKIPLDKYLIHHNVRTVSADIAQAGTLCIFHCRVTNHTPLLSSIIRESKK